MMTRSLLATTLAISLGFGFAAMAQTPPVGGPDAKGNAPLKAPHTVNDGAARPGANSFTEGQARQHILNSGYTAVSGLTKGSDGVWRGSATRNGAPVSVAMDFKGNVTQAMGSTATGQMTSTSSTNETRSMTETGSAAAGGAMMAGAKMHAHVRHHRRRHHHGRCADPGPNGAACSGVDTNGRGVSDREEHAIQAGAHP